MDIEKLGRDAINRIKFEYGLPKTGLIAGGSIANIIWELVSGNKAVVNDVDVFVFTGIIEKIDKSDKSIIHKYKEEDIKYHEDYNGLSYTSQTKDFYVICESINEGMFNTIRYKSNTNDPCLVINSFDINATKIGYSIDDDEFYWTEDFEDFLKTGNLKISNLRTPSHTSVRIVKKSKDLNVNLDELELNILQYALICGFYDVTKFKFKDRYRNMYLKNKEILDNYFILKRDKEMEKHVLFAYGEKTQLYHLGSLESEVFKDDNLKFIKSSSVFLFYIRNIYKDKEKTKFWSKLYYFFNDIDYFDAEADEADIDLIHRLCEYAPMSINNLSGNKLSDQILIVKKLINKFKDDPIIAISILENIKIDKDLELDDQTVLLLELSVRKEIINDVNGKVDKIVNYKRYSSDIDL